MSRYWDRPCITLTWLKDWLWIILTILWGLLGGVLCVLLTVLTLGAFQGKLLWDDVGEWCARHTSLK